LLVGVADRLGGGKAWKLSQKQRPGFPMTDAFREAWKTVTPWRDAGR
jgi:hypothetical protein